MNPWVIVGAFIVLIGASGGSFWFGMDYEQGQQAERTVLIKEARKEFVAANQEWTDGLAKRISQGFSGIRINNTTIERNIHNEVQTRFLDNPDCRIPLSTLRLLNAARGFGTGGSSAGGAEDGVRSDGEAGRKPTTP